MLEITDDLKEYITKRLIYKLLLTEEIDSKEIFQEFQKYNVNLDDALTLIIEMKKYVKNSLPDYFNENIHKIIQPIRFDKSIMTISLNRKINELIGIMNLEKGQINSRIFYMLENKKFRIGQLLAPSQRDEFFILKGEKEAFDLLEKFVFSTKSEFMNYEDMGTMDNLILLNFLINDNDNLVKNEEFKERVLYVTKLNKSEDLYRTRNVSYQYSVYIEEEIDEIEKNNQKR